MIDPVSRCGGASGRQLCRDQHHHHQHTMSNPAYDILYSTTHPNAIRERLVQMVMESKQVCIRLEMPISPVTLWGTIRMTEAGDFLVESSDQQSYATFNLTQVTSMGNTAIWITP